MDEQTLQKIIAEEREYGVHYEKIEQRYHFTAANRYEGDMEFEEDKEDRTGTNDNTSNDKFDAIYLPTGSITPSQSHSIPPQDELRLRVAGAEMILQAGYALKLPWYTIATGQALFQRFYYRVSFLDYDIRESMMACLFIATKIQESHRKLRDITIVFYHVFKVREGRQPPIPVLNSASDYYQYIKQMVMDSERVVLKELGFELYRLTEHPHNFLLDYLKRLRVSKEVAKKAWNYVNDSYRGTICIHYPPHIIAVSCLYLAIWSTQAPMPRNIWWAIFDTSIKHILEVCSDMLYLYELPKTEMKDIKVIIDAGYHANHLEKDFGLDHEETFEILKKATQSKEDREAKKEAEERTASKRDSRRPSHSRTSTKHSVSRDTRDHHRNKNKYSRDRYDRSPKRRKRSSSRNGDRDKRRSRTRSKERKKKKYSRSPSSSEEKGRRKRRDSEESRRKDSDSKKKKKRERSREKSREKSKDRRRDKERDDRDKHKHKKDKDKEKHRDRESEPKKDKEAQSEKKDTEKDEQSRSEKKPMQTEQTGAESTQKQKGERERKLSEKLEALKQESLAKSKSLTENNATAASAAALDLQALKSSAQEFAEKEENNAKPQEKEEDKHDYSSDEDTDKLLELKKKLMENKKKGKK